MDEQDGEIVKEIAMKKLFKDIRHNDIDAVRNAIKKNPAVVNEIFDGQKPQKDVGQSPLQVAIKCGHFEIINLLIENGADIDFIENPADKPDDTSTSYFMSMSVLHDAIIGAFGALPYGDFERAKSYVRLIETLLVKGADPNRRTVRHSLTGGDLPIDTALMKADAVLNQFSESDYKPNALKYDMAKKYLFEILDLLIKYGADFEQWLGRHSELLEDFIPLKERYYKIEYDGRIIEGIEKSDVDIYKEIRAALQEYMRLRT